MIGEKRDIRSIAKYYFLAITFFAQFFLINYPIFYITIVFQIFLLAYIFIISDRILNSKNELVLHLKNLPRGDWSDKANEISARLKLMNKLRKSFILILIFFHLVLIYNFYKVIFYQAFENNLNFFNDPLQYIYIGILIIISPLTPVVSAFFMDILDEDLKLRR